LSGNVPHNLRRSERSKKLTTPDPMSYRLFMGIQYKCRIGWWNDWESRAVSSIGFQKSDIQLKIFEGKTIG
jgi:hypothetical protein